MELRKAKEGIGALPQMRTSATCASKSKRSGARRRRPNAGSLLKAFKEEANKPRQSRRKTTKGVLSSERRQQKQETLRSRVSPSSKQSDKATVGRWSKVEESRPIRVNPANSVASSSGNGELMSPNTPLQRSTPKTQVNSKPNGEEREVVIGLDFGTACTKVAIRDDALGEVYAVPFGNLAHSGHPYLLATRVYADQGGCLNLQSGTFEIENLKIELLAGAENSLLSSGEPGADASALDICTGYLALVLREVLHWFLSEHGNSYHNCRLIWQLNIGVPSRSYDNKPELDMFQVLALAAWQEAVREGQVTVENSRIAVAKQREIVRDHKRKRDIVTNEPCLHPEDVGAIPEVIAEVVAYARSDLRREGTHLLVDVGASTLDVATFILHTNDGEDQFSLLTAEVRNLGAYVLHRQRITDIAKRAEDTLAQTLGQADGISPLPELSSYLPVDAESLVNVDQEFQGKCNRLISKILWETRTRRNPIAFVWDKGGELPVFVCGGGRSLRVYVESVESAVRSSAPHTHADLLSLPKPSNFHADESAPDEYDRLAVAFGLSTRKDRIGEVTPPAAIGDIDREVRGIDYQD